MFCLTLQMAKAKATAGIVSVAITAAAVLLIGLYWRWDQRLRDKALLATLEHQYSEKVRAWAA
jgi:hypothetical protein